MILYNIRYRGPYEYDKLILNVFQFHNAVNNIANSLKDSEDKNLVTYDNALSKLIEKLDTINLQLAKSFEETSLQ